MKVLWTFAISRVTIDNFERANLSAEPCWPYLFLIRHGSGSPRTQSARPFETIPHRCRLSRIAPMAACELFGSYGPE